MPVLCATENLVLQARGPGRRPLSAPCSGRLRSDDENFEGFTKFGGLSCSPSNDRHSQGTSSRDM